MFFKSSHRVEVAADLEAVEAAAVAVVVDLEEAAEVVEIAVDSEADAAVAAIEAASNPAVEVFYQNFTKLTQIKKVKNFFFFNFILKTIL